MAVQSATIVLAIYVSFRAWTTLLALACALAFGVSALAAAPGTTLTGSIEPSGSAKVRVKDLQHGGRQLTVYRALFKDVPLNCTDGTAATVDLGSGPIPTRRRDREFGLTVAYATPVGEEPVEGGWSFRATVVSGGRVDGVLRFRDDQFASPDTSTRDCRSGRLPWSVARAE